MTTTLGIGTLIVGGAFGLCTPEPTRPPSSPAPPTEASAPLVQAEALVAAADTTEQERLYREGVTFQGFLENATRRVDTWNGNYARAVVPPNLSKRAQILGEWRLLVIAEDWCGDSANTIPYLARLVEDVDGVDMRVVDSEAGGSLMAAHPTPDGRGATPTVLLLDQEGAVAGCWIERPTELQDWWLENEASVGREELLRQKYAWYDDDLGRTTMAEVVQMIEAAEKGDRWCAASP